MATKKPPEPKRGRPAGAKTQNLPVVLEVPRACPYPPCTSTEFKVLQTIPRDLAGEIDGQPYNQVTWRRVLCSGCERVYTIRSYEWIPLERAA